MQFYISMLFLSFSLNWQHQLCKNPRPNPDIKTLFTDHTCSPANGARPPPPGNSPLVGPVPKAGVFPPLGGHSVCFFAFSCLILLIIISLMKSSTTLKHSFYLISYLVIL